MFVFSLLRQGQNLPHLSWLDIALRNQEAIAGKVLAEAMVTGENFAVAKECLRPQFIHRRIAVKGSKRFLDAAKQLSVFRSDRLNRRQMPL